MRRQRASGDEPRATGYKFRLAPSAFNLKSFTYSHRRR